MASSATSSNPNQMTDYEVVKLKSTDNIKGRQQFSTQISTGNPTSVINLLSFPGRKFAVYEVHASCASNFGVSTGLCDKTFANSDDVLWFGPGGDCKRDMSFQVPWIFTDKIDFSSATVSLSINLIIIGRFL